MFVESKVELYKVLERSYRKFTGFQSLPLYDVIQLQEFVWFPDW